jgi:hypothetical protein
MYDIREPERRPVSREMDNVTAVLAELQEEHRRLSAELARVERVIDVIVALSGAEPLVRAAAPVLLLAAPDPPPPPVLAAATLPYLTMNAYEAVAAHLAEAKVPQTSRQIADALVAGGYPTRSTYFANVLATMLRRKESTRQYRISVTADGRRWFVRPQQSNTTSATPSEQS